MKSNTKKLLSRSALEKKEKKKIEELERHLAQDWPEVKELRDKFLMKIQELKMGGKKDGVT